MADPLLPGAVEDAVAYWLYAGGDTWEDWQLVPGSPRLSPDGQVLRMTFALEGERFELVLLRRGERVFAKHDDHDDPSREYAASLYRAPGEALVSFRPADAQVFVELELSEGDAP